MPNPLPREIEEGLNELIGGLPGMLKNLASLWLIEYTGGR
jgi:hypothetical protein